MTNISCFKNKIETEVIATSK